MWRHIAQEMGLEALCIFPCHIQIIGNHHVVILLTKIDENWALSLCTKNIFVCLWDLRYFSVHSFWCVSAQTVEKFIILQKNKEHNKMLWVQSKQSDDSVLLAHQCTDSNRSYLHCWSHTLACKIRWVSLWARHGSNRWESVRLIVCPVENTWKLFVFFVPSIHFRTIPGSELSTGRLLQDVAVSENREHGFVCKEISQHSELCLRN